MRQYERPATTRTRTIPVSTLRACGLGLGLVGLAACDPATSSVDDHAFGDPAFAGDPDVLEQVAIAPGGQAQAGGGKVVICHKDKHEITVSVNAVPAHLAHGDHVGACGAAPPVCGDGVVAGSEACEGPGSPLGACFDATAVAVCADDCSGPVPATCADDEFCVDAACVPGVCAPGSTSCSDDASVQTCAADAQGFEPPIACASGEGCLAGECVPYAELVVRDPTTLGLSFVAVPAFSHPSVEPLTTTWVSVANPSQTRSASVQLYHTPAGADVEAAEGAAVVVGPGGSHEFRLLVAPARASLAQVGGSYRVESDVPVAAHLHLRAKDTSDTAMLLPEHALRSEHIVATYGTVQLKNYLQIVAVEDDTTVAWSPRGATLAGDGVAAVAAGGTGSVTLGRGDLLQLFSAADLSGTHVTGNGKPLMVVEASECARVPLSAFACDLLLEQALPLDYWGSEYVGAHAPDRGPASPPGQHYYWRIFAGADDVEVVTDPPLPGTPFTLASRGDFRELEIPDQTSFMIRSSDDKPLLAVQYLAGKGQASTNGDPSMVQMVPTEQFDDRHAFAALPDLGDGSNPVPYQKYFAQVIRAAGGPDVLVDGQVVTGYYTVGDYEVADWPILVGPHVAASTQPFAGLQFAFSEFISYASATVHRLTPLNPQ